MKRKQRLVTELKCDICHTPLVYDYRTHAYVCPVCGIVYYYEMVPAYSNVEHTYPLEITVTIDNEVINKAKEEFNEIIVNEIKSLPKSIQREVLLALENLMYQKTHRVSWNSLRRAIEIARKYDLPISSAKMRETMILEQISKLVKEYKLDVDPLKILSFAKTYRKYWAGRNSKAVAQVFTYLYCKKYSCKNHVKPDKKYNKYIETLERIIIRGEENE